MHPLKSHQYKNIRCTCHNSEKLIQKLFQNPCHLVYQHTITCNLQNTECYISPITTAFRLKYANIDQVSDARQTMLPKKNKMAYLIARLSFSYVILGLSLREPHSFATFSLRTNLKTPSSQFSQQIKLGQQSRFRSKSLINSHNLPVFFSV